MRVYERPNRLGSVKPIGHVCNLCRMFVPDEVQITNLQDLRFVADAIAQEIMTLSLDRAVYERTAGIIRANGDLLVAAQSSNPFLNGMRRWWGVATAVVLRRNLDGSEGTLRAIVDALAESHPDLSTQFTQDRETLENIRTRLGPFLNALIHGVQAPETHYSESPMTYGDLSFAVETVRDIAERACSAIRNVSQRLDPVIQFDWTTIFRQAWISSDADDAYNLGAAGVPVDAEPLARADVARQAILVPEGLMQPDGSIVITLKNEGKNDALSVRLFLPYERTVIDIPKLVVGGTVLSEPIPSDRAVRVCGQVVIEFCDLRGRVFREYAAVYLLSGRFREVRGPYYVRDQIVASKVAAVV